MNSNTIAEKIGRLVVVVTAIRLSKCRTAILVSEKLKFVGIPRFVVRDFTYNETELDAGRSQLTKLATDKKKQFVS